MSTTLMPFLYQTRTLYSFARAGFSLPPSLSRPIHTTTPSLQRGTEDSIPFELPPDVARHNPDTRGVIEEGYVPNPKDTITPEERQTFKDIFREIAQRRKAPLTTGRVRRSKSNTTPRSEILGPADLDIDPRLGADTQHAVNVVIEDAARTYSDTRPGIHGLDRLSPLETTYSAAEREAALLRFPPSLRRAARWAFGTVEPGMDDDRPVRLEGGELESLAFRQEEDAEDAEEGGDVVEKAAKIKGDRLGRIVELEALRREERLRIQELMKGAKSDFELWDVMEQEVFPLVERLGISEKNKTKVKSSKGRKEIAAKKEDEPEETEHSKKPLSMEIYGAIYPQLLLEGINYLDTKFQRSSPLCFSILPQVKALGLTSYVLGISTSFYNRLMAITWHRFGDAGAVMDLLEEMRHAGLYFDENSQGVVHSIEHAFIAAANGTHGKFARSITKMPEFEPLVELRIKHWLASINRSIEERRKGLGY